MIATEKIYDGKVDGRVMYQLREIVARRNLLGGGILVEVV